MYVKSLNSTFISPPLVQKRACPQKSKCFIFRKLENEDLLRPEFILISKIDFHNSLVKRKVPTEVLQGLCTGSFLDAWNNPIHSIS